MSEVNKTVKVVLDKDGNFITMLISESDLDPINTAYLIDKGCTIVDATLTWKTKN